MNCRSLTRCARGRALTVALSLAVASSVGLLLLALLPQAQTMVPYARPRTVGTLPSGRAARSGFSISATGTYCTHPLTAEWECRRAAAALGKRWGGTVERYDHSNCLFVAPHPGLNGVLGVNPGNNVYFNRVNRSDGPHRLFASVCRDTPGPSAGSAQQAPGWDGAVTKQNIDQYRPMSTKQNIAVVTVTGDKNSDRSRAQRETWLDGLHYVVYETEHGVLKGNDHLKAFSLLVSRYSKPNFHWYMLTDDDTYVVTQRLFEALAEHDPEQPLYMGAHHCKGPDFLCANGYLLEGLRGWVNGGAGIVISRKTANEIDWDSANEYWRDEALKSRWKFHPVAADALFACVVQDYARKAPTTRITHHPGFFMERFGKGECECSMETRVRWSDTSPQLCNTPNEKEYVSSHHISALDIRQAHKNWLLDESLTRRRTATSTKIEAMQERIAQLGQKLAGERSQKLVEERAAASEKPALNEAKQKAKEREALAADARSSSGAHDIKRKRRRKFKQSQGLPSVL